MVHCWASMSELYGVFVLHRHFLFKALPSKVLIIVNVYTGNEILSKRLNSLHKTQNGIKYTFSILSDTSKL